jgi:hypothetical protein
MVQSPSNSVQLTFMGLRPRFANVLPFNPLFFGD